MTGKPMACVFIRNRPGHNFHLRSISRSACSALAQRWSSEWKWSAGPVPTSLLLPRYTANESKGKHPAKRSERVLRFFRIGQASYGQATNLGLRVALAKVADTYFNNYKLW